MNKENETQVPIELEFNNLNISDKDSNSVIINNKNCSYCNNPFTEELWCKKCDPRCIIEGWTSGNYDIDKFLEWVPFDRFKDIKQIGVGGFAKVYSTTWIDGEAKYKGQDDGSWKKDKPEPMKVALKRLNGSQNMSAEYFNEVFL